MADDRLRELVADTMEREGVCAAVEAIYNEIETALKQIGPRCEMSGRCCRFEEYGHRLYVTTMELAAFAQQARQMAQLVPWSSRHDGAACRYQDGRLCMAHLVRPIGCRLFFCDASKESALQTLYERMHGQLKQAHERLAVPYRYVEWRTGLADIEELLIRRAD